MAISNSDIESVVEADLAELVTAGAAEGMHLDFKESSYGGSDADKRELLKDVSALANSGGGHIVVGMREENGYASALLGVALQDPDAEVLRIEQIIRSGIDPRPLGTRVKAVRIANGAFALLIRVKRSLLVPHRVSAQGWNRFWIRNSGGCHEASIDELRALFEQTSTVLTRARAFRDNRLDSIIRGEGPRPLVADGRFVVHIFPHSAFLSSEVIDAEVIFRSNDLFRPIGSNGHRPRYNFDGVLNERGGDENYGYTQIFRNGIVEATKAGVLRTFQGRPGVPGQSLETDFFRSLTSYIDGLRTVGIQPPLIVLVTLQGVSGAYYHVLNDPWLDELTPFDRDLLHLHEGSIGDYGSAESYHSALRGPFDSLWNAVGLPRSRFFNDAGLWVGPGRK